MKKIFFILSFFALLVSGCRSTREAEIRFYLLEYPDEYYTPESDYLDPDAVSGKTCRISGVEVHPAFASHKIAIRENSNEIRYFSYNQWAVRPGQSLDLILKDFLRRKNVFKTILSADERGETDYTLETYIPRLEVVRNGKVYNAHIETKFRLKNNLTGTTVLEYRSDSLQELDERCLNQFSSEISRMFVQELHKFVLKINYNLAKAEAGKNNY